MNDSLELLKRFEEITRARYSVGEAIQQDVLRSQVEISILDQRLTSMQQERATAAAEINRLLNRPVDAPLSAPVELTSTSLVMPPETAQAEYLIQAPQIRSGEAMVERERKGLDLAKKQYRPDFMTSVEYANNPELSGHVGNRVRLAYPDLLQKQTSFRSS